MSAAHGIPAAPRGEEQPDVERLKGLDDGQFLVVLRANEVLSPLSRAVGGQRERRFMGEVATVINMLRVRMSDMLFSFAQRVAVQEVMFRHRSTLEASDLIEVLCSRIEVLAGWGFSSQQQFWLKERLDIVGGVGRHVLWEYGDGVVLSQLRLGRLEPPPFLLGVLFTVINPSFRALHAAKLLGAVRNGRWADDDRTYVPTVKEVMWGGRGSGPVWRMTARGGQDMGDVSLVGQGDVILRIEFAMAWPREVRGSGSQFLPAACRLGLTGPEACRRTGTPAPLVRTPRTDVVYLTFARDAWVRRMGNLPAELAAVLEGRYCISKIDQNMRPIFRRNLASWTDNPEAQEALWPEVAKMLWRGTFEYIQRGWRLPLAVMAVGAVPKSTDPFWRLVTDARPVNVLQTSGM